MPQTAKLKSGWGKFCGGEANLSYRPALRGTSIRSLRQERTRIREWLERPAALGSGNFIDRLKVALPHRSRARPHARHLAPPLVPRDAKSQEMRQEPWPPRDPDISRK